MTHLAFQDSTAAAGGASSEEDGYQDSPSTDASDSTDKVLSSTSEDLQECPVVVMERWCANENDDLSLMRQYCVVVCVSDCVLFCLCCCLYF